MAGNGRHPSKRLDRDGPDACAAFIARRVRRIGTRSKVWLIDTTGVVIRHHGDTSRGHGRFRHYVGEFWPWMPASEIARALASVDTTPPADLNLALRTMPSLGTPLLGIADA